MTHFLYHRLPSDLVGSDLYPLNQLKGKFPSIYASQAKKYAGREQLMQRTVPILNCLWNDVLHLSPVHPSLIRDALKAVGFYRFPKQWLKINPETAVFSQKNAVIYLYASAKRGVMDISVDDFVPFSLSKLAQVGQLPVETANYYREMKDVGKRPLLFHHVPHILYQGVIPLSAATIIEV